ncbi:MAG: NAD(P)H-binding protein [Anaerolineae bacterium]|nr:NAD(P)H-binding protein [Anaerolineae bacterium]
MARRNWNKVFVTGGTGFIGRQVVTALVNAGADVTVLVRPENEEKLGSLRRHIHMVSGDVWNVASLKGRSRGNGVVIHLVGSIRAQPERGFTFHQLNLVSARNAISMAVSDGVPYFMLLSPASRPAGVSVEYVRSKREAEKYLRNSGLRWAIVRAPLLFDRDQSGGHFYAMLSRVGALPFLRVFFGRRSPLPVDIAAQGIARAALLAELPPNRLLYAGDLRRLGREIVGQRQRTRIKLPQFLPRRDNGDDLGEDETPFGWLPPKAPPEDDR